MLRLSDYNSCFKKVYGLGEGGSLVGNSCVVAQDLVNLPAVNERLTGVIILTHSSEVHSMIHRKRKLFSEEECSETASSRHTHDPPGVKFEMEEFGSVTKEVEALHARRLRLFRSLNGVVEAPRSQRLQLLSHEQIQALRLKLSNRSTVESELDVEKTRNEEHFKSVDQKDTNFPRCGVIKLEDDSPICKVMAIDTPVEILDSDDEDNGYKTHTEVETSGIKVESNDKECRDHIHGHIGEIDKPGVIHDSADKDLGHEMHSHHYQKVVDESSIKFPDTGVILSLSAKYIGPRGAFSSSALAHACMDVITDKNVQEKMFEKEKAPKDEVGYVPVTCDTGRGKSAYASTENDMVMNEDKQLITSDDGLTDIWKDMAFALESSKGLAAVPSTGEHMEENGEECDHSFVLKDDIGSVCRICGVIDRSIDTIFEFLYPKGRRSTRTYSYDSENRKGKESTDVNPAGDKYTEDGLMVTEIFAHPRHSREMKPHQVEGFKFLCSNLLCDDPGGCILAHAPGSGKTFVIISFIQGFLAKFPNARPLIILPIGILATWKKEFQTWQVEDIPLLDFYSSKAKNRSQQLDVLKKWEKQRSVLFLGYKQFSAIVCDAENSKVAAQCQDILLKVPKVVILDEGHTPRNEETDVVRSLAKIQTPLKVVLSGTLYQNHVIEVFNVLNLVRPGFLRLDTTRTIVKRILSKVIISGVKKQFRESSDTAFYDLVEHTIQRDDDFKRKVSVIQDLREMTSRVLHYYKGDFLDELPELIDLTVLLNLSSKQKDEVKKIKNLDRFKQISLGSSVYMHPKLKYISQKHQASGDKGSVIDDEKMDAMLQELDVREGVKMKFVLHIMGLCELSEEKLLVFSQYILPLKLLERMAVKYKGWRPGKELFTITGDTSAEHRERCMEQFNGSADAKVLFGSIKACGEGISLVGASRVIILDVHLNPSVTRQAIGRAYRRPQNKKVYVYRLVAADSPEQEDYLTCSRKELISKMWFEWNEYCGDHEFDVKTVDVNECGDRFLESPMLKDDIKVLYQR